MKLHPILLVWVLIYGQALWANSPTIPLTIGNHVFQVEVARTPKELAQGLMFREDLAPTKGMLFVYPRPMVIVAWMKNTLISLDLVFLNAAKKIVHIHHRASPQSEAKINSRVDSKYFIELPGGTCEKQGIKIGQTAKFKI